MDFSIELTHDKKNKDQNSKLSSFSVVSANKSKFDQFEKIIAPTSLQTSQETSNMFDKFNIPVITDNITVLPKDKFATKKQQELENVEKEITQVARSTIESLLNNGENEEDCYIAAIKEALRTLDDDCLLECVSEILEILEKYQSENEL